MNRFFLSVIISLFGIGTVFSQFDAQFSQYMFNIPSFNPAAVGEGDLIQVMLQGRYQGLRDTTGTLGITTSNMGINSPLKIGNSTHGVGFRGVVDKLGLFSNNGMYLQYAHKTKLKSGTLSFGADIGETTVGFLGSKVNLADIDEYHTLTDARLPQSDVSGARLDINVGAFYSSSEYFVGLSFSHITSPTIIWDKDKEYKMKGAVYLTGGFNYILPNKKYILRPTTLIKSDYRSYQVDVSTRLDYDNKYWGGLFCRLSGLGLYGGANLDNGLALWISYDLPTSKLYNGTLGTVEVLVSYNFAYVFEKRNTRYKSIRIL